MSSEPRSEQSRTEGRVLLIGVGITSASALASLVDKFEVLGLVRPIGPDTGNPDATVQRAIAQGVRVYPDASLKAIRSLVSVLQPDCVVVSSYNRILPAELLEQTRFVNVHYAPLPAYRGRANVNWAIINGEPCAGISIHTIAPGLDAGNILHQETIPIGDNDTVADLYARLNAIQLRMLGETVQRLLLGYSGHPQDEVAATYGCTRIPEDGEVDWGAPTASIHRLVRALVPPFPGALTYLGGTRLTLWRAEPLTNAPRYDGRVPGRVIAFSKQEGHADVLTGDGVLRLLEVQVPGHPPGPASTVISSISQTLGLRTSELLARIERLERMIAALTVPSS